MTKVNKWKDFFGTLALIMIFGFSAGFTASYVFTENYIVVIILTGLVILQGTLIVTAAVLPPPMEEDSEER